LKRLPLKRAWAKAMRLAMTIDFPVEIRGQVQRQASTVSDIDLLVTVPETNNPAHPEWWASFILGRTGTQVLEGGMMRATGLEEARVNLWVCTEEEKGAFDG